MSIKMNIIIPFLFVIVIIMIISTKTHKVDEKKSVSYRNRELCPWYVLIKAPNLICGGIILNSSTILTAAHCVYDQKNVMIYPGVVDRLSLPRGFRSKKIILHEYYDSENLYNDIAIVKVDKIPFSNNIFSINLPFRSPTLDETALVSGFGIARNEKLSRFLRTFEVKISLTDYCILKYGEDFNSKLQICAGNLYNSLDFCTGDSGGPLYQQQNNIWVVVGIVSFTGKQCADGFPSVYTDIFGYLPWIQRFL